MTILVLAEHNNQQLNPNTLSAISAAKQHDADVHVLVAGHQCQAVAEQLASIADVQNVLHADDPAYGKSLAENISALLAELMANYNSACAPASTFGKNIFPRLAALLDVGMVSDITAIIGNNQYARPIYAGNAIETVENHHAKQLFTVRSTAFEKAAGGGQATIEAINQVHDAQLSEFVSHDLNASERPDLTQARVVVSGGRALQSADNFKLLEGLADTLNAAIGASRAAVDAGFVPNDYQVGQTGKIVAPELYIAVGISGAIQHIAGMKDSKVIVAVNKDADAPIFKIADYGLVGDLFDIIPELNQTLQSHKDAT